MIELSKRDMDQQKKDKTYKKQARTFYKRHEYLRDLKKLAAKLALPDYNLDDFQQEDKQLFKCFCNSFENPFYDFKEHSTVKRTLIKHKYLPKPEHSVITKVKALIKEIEEKEKKRLQAIEDAKKNKITHYDGSPSHLNTNSQQTEVTISSL